jgi:hypothetical protein
MSYETGLSIDNAPMWVIIVILISWFFSSAWIIRDSIVRGKNPFVVFLFHTIAGWPLSILWWLYLRPPKRKGAISEVSS